MTDVPYSKNYTGTGAWQDRDGTIRGDDTPVEPQHEEATTPNLLHGMRNGAWLHVQKFPPLRYAVPGLIPEGLSVLVGPPKAGKSWAALGIALAVASGGVALGTIPVGPARPSLYLALEDGDRRLQERCRRLLGPDTPIPHEMDYMTRLIGGAVPTIDQWLDATGDQNPVVLLDTLGKVLGSAGPGRSQYDHEYTVMGRLKEQVDTRPGSSLIVLHHDRKASSDDYVDSVSGTNGIAGAADTVLVLCRSRNETRGILKLTSREVPENEYAVELSGGLWRLVGADLGDAARSAADARATANLGDRQVDIFNAVKGHPDGVSPAKLALQLGMDGAQMRAYLSRLHEKRRIRKKGRGLYAPLP